MLDRVGARRVRCSRMDGWGSPPGFPSFLTSSLRYPSKSNDIWPYFDVVTPLWPIEEGCAGMVKKMVPGLRELVPAARGSQGATV